MNPEHLICDTDVLLQLFIARQGRLLSYLQQAYAVSLAIVPEVETEVSWNRRYRSRFEPVLVRHMQHGAIIVLEAPEIARLLRARDRTPPQVDQELADLHERSRRYARHVGRGEAYSHAAGVALELPVFSHDWSAVTVLEAIPEPVAVPVLRVWDLVALAFDDGAVTVADIDHAVNLLRRENEVVPAFLAKSPGEAIRRYDSRLRRVVPGGTPARPRQAKDRLFLAPVQTS